MWTEEVTNDTVTWWNDGQSGSDISKAFAERGVELSREAIVAKIFRLRQEGVVLRGGKTAPKKRSPKTYPWADQSEKPKPKAKAAPPLEEMPEMDTAFVPLVTNIVDLEDHHCRYMHGDASNGHYCGRDKVHGSSYCSRHHQRVWGASR